MAPVQHEARYAARGKPVLALEGRRSKAQGERTREPWDRAGNRGGAARNPPRDPRHAGRRPRARGYAHPSPPRVRGYAHPGLYYDALPGLKTASGTAHKLPESAHAPDAARGRGKKQRVARRME